MVDVRMTPVERMELREFSKRTRALEESVLMVA